MTELEKIAYAKTFIDKLANGINPLDDTPISEDDIVNNIRLSRCFFYVSDILRQVLEEGARKQPKKVERLPFSLTPEQIQHFEYTATPISATALARKINGLVWDAIEAKKMERLSYQKITQWLLDIGMIEYREWEDGRMKRFPTADGEEMGLITQVWENYGRRSPVVFYSEDAQRFIMDHLEAVIATEVKKREKTPRDHSPDEENDG